MSSVAGGAEGKPTLYLYRDKTGSVERGLVGEAGGQVPHIELS